MSKKVKISIKGNEFLIPSESIQECSYDKVTYVHMRAKLVASIIKQFVKKNYPRTSTVYFKSMNLTDFVNFFKEERVIVFFSGLNSSSFFVGKT